MVKVAYLEAVVEVLEVVAGRGPLPAVTWVLEEVVLAGTGGAVTAVAAMLSRRPRKRGVVGGETHTARGAPTPPLWWVTLVGIALFPALKYSRRNSIVSSGS